MKAIKENKEYTINSDAKAAYQEAATFLMTTER